MNGVVVAPQPLAAAAGLAAFRAGGNAFDAAVATAFAQGLVDPSNTGLGGGVTCVAKPAGQPAFLVSALNRAPMHLPPDLWADKVLSQNPEGGGFLVEGFDNQVGYRSVCTPGAVAGLWEVHQANGRLDWGETIEPSVRLAQGFALPAETRTAWRVDEPQRPGYVSPVEKLGWTPGSRAIYLKDDGSPYRIGETIVCEDYGRTLGLIAEHGPDVFYRGAIAERIDADFRANGGFLCGEDLERYQAQRTTPAVGRYRGLDVATSQAPMSGVQLIELLHVLDHIDLGSMNPRSATYIDVTARAMQATFVDRAMCLGDPEFSDVPVEWMTSAEHTAELAERVLAGERFNVPRMDLHKRNDDSPDTTHVSVWDSDGNAVAITHSLGSASGVVTPGLGFTYNNMMHIFNPFPGHPNSIEPFKRRTGGASPTILSRDGEPVLISGAPGGVRIPIAVLFSIMGVIDHGWSPAEALAVPRWHSETDALHVEAGIAATMADELAALGWDDIRGKPWSLDPFFFARAQTIEIVDGVTYRAASDPRGGGCVAHFADDD